jgi:hypothetical protein
MVLGGIALFVLMAVASGCGASTSDNPALAAKIQQAIASEGGGAAIHDVTADSDDHVIVTLLVRKEDMGGDVQAEDAGKAVAATVFHDIPEVSQVSVFDANNSMIDIYSRR